MTKKFRTLVLLLLIGCLSSLLSAQSWKFIVYGDTRTNDDAHRSVLQAIKKNTPGYEFIISTGDVVARGSDTSAWQTWQAAVNDVLGGIGQHEDPPKYIAAPGNHDDIPGPGEANWAQYLPGQQRYGNGGRFFSFDHKDARFIILNSQRESLTDSQKTLLLEALRKEPKKWLFAFWHKPIFPFGKKKYEAEIHTEWGVPLYQHGCDVIFIGHAHYYARTKKVELNGEMNPPIDELKGTVQLITGGGGAPLYEVDSNQDDRGYLLEKAISSYGYTECTIDGDRLTMRHILADGTIFDEVTLTANPKLLPLAQASAEESTGQSIAATVRCSDAESQDQDDMCVWVHPTEPAQSIIIAADKKANKLFVYNLEGKTIQVIAAQHPGNIDVRYGFPLGEEKVDIIAYNQRDDPKIVVHKVVPASRKLERADNGAITTGENYGGTLFKSPKTGQFYFVTTSKSGQVEQYELSDDGRGKIQGKKVRTWTIGKCEAAVADDSAGKVYIGEEERGIWKVGGEPDDAAPGELIIKVGDNGLIGDVEGLAIYHLTEGRGYLLVSNQKINDFKVYRREGPHEFVGTFAIEGAKQTDGLDVLNVNLGPGFSTGLFACHSAEELRCPVLLIPWESIAKLFQPGLVVSTVWSPRK